MMEKQDEEQLSEQEPHHRETHNCTEKHSEHDEQTIVSCDCKSKSTQRTSNETTWEKNEQEMHKNVPATSETEKLNSIAHSLLFSTRTTANSTKETNNYLLENTHDAKNANGNDYHHHNNTNSSNNNNNKNTNNIFHDNDDVDDATGIVTSETIPIISRNTSGTLPASSSTTSQSTIINVGTSRITTGATTPSGTLNTEGSPTWRKVLYERQPFEDNYVDPNQFLRDLRMNENVTTYKYEDVMQNTVVITQHISIVVIFVFMFTMELRGKLGKYSLLYIDLFVISVLWVLQVHLRISGKEIDRSGSNVVTNDSVSSHHRLSQRSLLWAVFADINPSVFSLVIILVLLTPILSTLTVSYSDDTIVALSVLTMLLHVITADYSYLNAYTHKYQPNISVNAATFAVILMASRIQSPLKNGELIAFGTICFSISPIARHALKRYSFTGHVIVTYLLFSLATLCLLEIPILAFLFIFVCGLISFIIPIFFVRLHSSVKTQINGPWDEAKPTNSAAAAEWANAGLLS